MDAFETFLDLSVLDLDLPNIPEQVPGPTGDLGGPPVDQERAGSPVLSSLCIIS